MNITAIKQQERLKGRYSVYVDEKYAFSLSADSLLEQGLHVGQELDAAELKAYKKLSADDKAYGLALAYVARRMRSRGELMDYFRRKGYDEALRGQIMTKLENLRLVDDAAFAEAWVRNRRLLKNTSTRRLRQELRAKHVADDTIARVLAEDAVSDRDALGELINKKRRQTRYRDDQKLIQYLARQGFSYQDIKNGLEPDD